MSQGQDIVAALATVPAAWQVLGCLGACSIIGVLYAVWDARRLAGPPELSYQNNKFNDAVLSRMPALRKPFKPLPFLTNGHVETIFAAKTRTKIDVTYRREVLHMPDGGIVSLDWRVPRKGEQPLPDDAAVLILLPGLTGGSDDSYIRYAAHYAETHGTRAVVFNSRGCGDTFVTTPRYYSGLYIGDLQRVVHAVRLRHPRSHMFAAGWSLGANILTNYLGLVGEDTPLHAAAVMCNPFDLVLGSHNLMKGFNQIYSKNLGTGMSKLMKRNLKVWNGVGEEFDIATACNAPSVRAWDHAITRVSFGFKSVDDYYKAASSAQRVGGVRVPLLVIQAADDPIAPISGTPVQALRDNPNCILAVTKTGGHLGWVSDVGGYFGEPWTDSIFIEWLLSVQVQLSRDAEATLEGRNGSRLPPPVAPTPSSHSKALPSSLQPSVHNAELALQRTPPLTVTSRAAGSGPTTSSTSSNGNRRVAARANGANPSPRSPRSGEIYDAVSGLPVQKHDGVSLSPSQTGYFSTAGDRGPRDSSRQLRLEDVYKGAKMSEGAGAKVNECSQKSEDSSVNGRAPASLPVVSKDDAVGSVPGVQEGVGRKAPPAQYMTSTPSGNNGSGDGSSARHMHRGLSTPALQSSTGSLLESQGPDKVTSPFSSTGDLPLESSYPMLGSRDDHSTAQHASQHAAQRNSTGPSTETVHPPKVYEMTPDGLKEVSADSDGDDDVDVNVTPPRLGGGSVDSTRRVMHQKSKGVHSEAALKSDQFESRNAAEPSHAGGSTAQHAEDRSCEGAFQTQCSEADTASGVDWVNASPQRIAGAAAALRILYEAASSKRTSAASGTGSEWGDVSNGRVGEVLRNDRHMLAPFGEGVAKALKGRTGASDTQQDCASEVSGSLDAAIGATSSEPAAESGPDCHDDTEKHLNVLSAIRLSSGSGGAPADGSLSDSTGGREPVTAAATSSTYGGRSGQQQLHRHVGDTKWIGSGAEGVRKTVWWKT